MLGAALAEQQGVLGSDVADHGLVDLVAADPHGPGVTMPPRLITATSVVPPPMSTTMLAAVSLTGRSAPIAAAIGSSMT